MTEWFHVAWFGLIDTLALGMVHLSFRKKDSKKTKIFRYIYAIVALIFLNILLYEITPICK